MTRIQLARLGKRLTWLVLVALSGYYLYRAVNYRFITPDRLGPGLLDKQLWYFGHAIAALTVIVGAPLQFIPSLREMRLFDVVHRSVRHLQTNKKACTL